MQSCVIATHFPSGDDSFRVIDYKLSKPSGAKNNDFSKGDHLQLPIYLLGSSTILDRPVCSGIAEYREVGIDGSRSVFFEGSKLEEKREELDTIIDTIISSIENGLFFYYPAGRACRYCDYKPSCPASRDRMFRNKVRFDKRLGRYRTMKQLED